ncbi:MAG: hypothetical protein ACK4VI_02895 [Alphaproteobacteria bacterium]
MHSYEEAKKHLEALDDLAWAFTFQTFDDTGGNNKSICRILHGSLEEHWPTLVDLNERGAGIFVTVNETDLKGRSKDNIVDVRALFLDDDGGVKEPPIKPHIRVKTSPNKQHLYYLIDSKEWKSHE